MTWKPDAGLQGKGIIITGATGGIGASIAQAFATVGAHVLAVDMQQQATESLVAQLPGTGHLGMAADLRDLDTHAEIVQRARSAFGTVYGLVHLAAVLRRQYSIDQVTVDDWDLQADTNLKASFFLCRTCAQAMVEQGQGGRIITFSSQGWWTGGVGGSVVYSATKGGIVSMTRGLARTYGPHNITVNSVAPGMINTPMLLTDLDPSQLATMIEATPLKRLGEPDDITGAVLFLASQQASFITGSTLNISGGYLMY